MSDDVLQNSTLSLERGEVVRPGDLGFVDPISGRLRRARFGDRGRKLVVPASARREGAFLVWDAGDEAIDLTDADPFRASRPTIRPLPRPDELKLLRDTRLGRVTAAGSPEEDAMAALARKAWVRRSRQTASASLWQLDGDGYSFGLETPLTALEFATRAAGDALFAGKASTDAQLVAARALAALGQPRFKGDGRDVAALAVKLVHVLQDNREP